MKFQGSLKSPSAGSSWASTQLERKASLRNPQETLGYLMFFDGFWCDLMWFDVIWCYLMVFAGFLMLFAWKTPAWPYWSSFVGWYRRKCGARDSGLGIVLLLYTVCINMWPPNLLLKTHELSTISMAMASIAVSQITRGYINYIQKLSIYEPYINHILTIYKS